jgi:hypothetical protein
MSDAPPPQTPEEPAPRVEAARIDAYVAIWMKAVDTQMHFNEMSAKSRQLGLTFAAAALGVSIVLLSRKEDFALVLPLWFADVSLHISVLIILATAAAVYAVSILDLNVYHRMLRGAVTFGEDFEENYIKQIVQLDKGMTQAISHYSRVDDARVITEGLRYRYRGNRPVGRAQHKIQRFYNVVIIGLIFAAVVLFLATHKIQQPAAASSVQPTTPSPSTQSKGLGAPAKSPTTGVVPDAKK